MKNENTKDIAVIGGGFSGLILANHLALSGHQITLIEAGPQLGGLAGTFEQNGYQVDKFYHHFFQQDEELLELISQLGLDDELIESKTKSGFYFDGSWYDVSSPLQLLSFKPLSFSRGSALGKPCLKREANRSHCAWMMYL